MEFAPSGGNRGSSEEGDGDKCFDRGHLCRDSFRGLRIDVGLGERLEEKIESIEV